MKSTRLDYLIKRQLNQSKNKMSKIKIKAETVGKAYKELKSALTEKEKNIITKYYGIVPDVRHTLAELGKIYKVTRERIRQIKVIALNKLKIKN